MTNKQVIIDDQKKTIHRLQDECTEKTNAIIALGVQLKAKEQECEELKKQIKYEFDETLLQYSNELDRLKAENEELTTINARLLGRLEVDETDTSLVFNLDKELRQKEKEFYTAIQKVVKLKQTLTEIKELLLKTPTDSPMHCVNAKSVILRKISEVEDGI